MARQVDAQHLLLHLQQVLAVEVRRLGQVPLDLDARHAAVVAGQREQGHLAFQIVLGAGLRGFDQFADHRQLLRPVAREAVHGAGFDEALQRGPVDRMHVQPVHEFEDVAGHVAPARGDDLLHDAFAHVLDAQQTVADLAVLRGEVLGAAVDVGLQRLDVHVLRVADQHRDRLVVGGIRHQGRQELGRIVALQPGRLISDDRVGCRMGFIERVSRETRHFVEDLVGDLLGHPVADAAGHVDGTVLVQLAVDEVLSFLRHDVRLFLGHGAAHQVGAAVGVPAQFTDDVHDLLLVDDAAVGRRQDGFQLRAQIRDLLRMLLALDVGRDGVHRTGPVQRNACDQVFQTGRAQVLHEPGHAAGFQLEDAGRVAASDEFVYVLVVVIDPVEVDVFAGIFFDEFQTFPDGRQVAQAQEVHLQQAQMLDLGHGELGRQAFIRHDQRHVGVHRVLGDHDARSVGGAVPRQAFQDLGRIHDVPDLRVRLVDAPEIRALLQRFVQRDLQIFGDHLRDLQRPRERHLHDLRHVLEDRAGFQGPERGDLRHVVDAIALFNVIDDLASALDAEVHVDIGHGYALDVQEALENQAEFDGVDVGDLHRVSDDGTCGGTSARADHDAMALRVVDEVPDDQEVADVTHGLDRLHFVAHAVLQFRVHVGRQRFHVLGRHRRIRPAAGGIGLRLAVAVFQAGPAQVFEERLLRVAFRHLADRDVVIAEFEVEITLIHDLLRDVAGFRDVREDLAHLLLGLQVKLVVGEAHAVRIRKAGLRADAQQHVVRLGILLIDIVGIVRRDEGDVQLFRQLLEHGVDLLFLVQALVLDLQVEVAPAEAVLQPLRFFLRAFVVVFQQQVLHASGQAGRQGDDAFAVGRQKLAVHAGFIVEARLIGFGNDLDQVLVAGLVLREQDQVALVLVEHGVLVEAGAGGRIDLAADDGLDALLFALFVELHAAEHDAVVRDGQRLHAQFLGAGDELVDARSAVQQTVFGMYVKMGVAHSFFSLHYGIPGRVIPDSIFYHKDIDCVSCH